ncbi:hypothetical protein [Pseudoalteromonas sp. T1lg48]|uniref:hypothetical protein n=1 Tax=Pseudoalteromonas sp. T1lg48 TaxID=2077100 RepID=UPI000CF6C70F|nr:hypothetical protein [Pseudoalteromonas sp. T1lg48]
MNSVWLLIGLAVALIIMITFARRGLWASRKGYPLLLASFPLYYWLFALWAMDFQALLYEAATAVVFFLLAGWAIKSRNPARWWLAGIGMLLHAGYDFFHDTLFSNAGTPTWWPEFCGMVDLVLALYLCALATSSGALRLPGQRLTYKE